jgi:hypothetical protein
MKVLFFSKMNDSLYGFGISDTIDSNTNMGPINTVIVKEENMEETLEQKNILLTNIQKEYIRTLVQGYIIFE